MKKPENFRKIDGVTFTTKTNNEYKFSVDTPKGDMLWIFAQPDNTAYSLAFVIDWETEVYQIRRAKNGDGKNWIDTIYSGGFTSQPMKTLSSFVDWVHHRVLEFEHNYNNL
jgi:hypothetical protein